MRYFALLVIGFLMTLSVSHAQNSYTMDWKKVDSLESLGQPKSALEIVDKIYEQSKKDNDEAQFIKSVIYRVKLKAQFFENPLERGIDELKAEIKNAEPPVKQVFISMLAELYDQYYMVNQWQIRDRTRISGSLPDSINTWDLNTLQDQINKTYMASLEKEDLLKRIPIEDFEAILEIQSDNFNDTKKRIDKNVSFRPTLYDFLAWRALDHYIGGREARNEPSGSYRITDPRYFLPGGEWMSVPTPDPDTASTASYAMIIFRKLTAMHLPDKDQRALIDVELARLDFIHREGNFSKRDSLYIVALKNIEKKYIASPWSTDISFALASFLVEQGNLYDPRISDAHKWEIKEAKEICDAAILHYPASEGAKKCQSLINSILQKSVNLTVESVIPDKPFLSFFSWKNSDKVIFRIVKTDPDELERRISGLNDAERNKYLLSLPVYKKLETALPQDGDFQLHSTQLEMPALKNGYYLLIALTSEDPADSNRAIAHAEFYSTKISYISRGDEEKRLQLFILDRESGKPLKGAVVETFIKKFDHGSNEYITRKTGKFISNDEGFLVISAPSSEDRYGFYMRISLKDDFYITRSFYLYPPYTGDSKETFSTTFFTDRSIYRPGQTVYFKGIILKQKDKNKEIAPNKTITISFLDANSQEIIKKRFTSNEFGSVNGSFVIPVKGLTGYFSISTESGSIGIRVEEYKRPTFEAEFNPVEGNFRLNDSIHVTGKAKAFAGNPITGAKVKYRVVRTARFPFWDRWWIPFPPSSETEIINGTTSTEADGTFSFSFFALPDLSIEEKYEPVFDFHLYADVTDLNGETRQTEDYIAVGYTSLMVGISIPGKLNLKHDSTFEISSTNLSYQKTAADVKVLIQQLVQPEKALRKRNWEQPDIFIIPEKEFKNQFPDDVYKNEDDPASWTVSLNIFEKIFSTANDSVLRLKEMTGLSQGVYRVTLTATDPYGKPVKMTKHFAVFDPDSKEVPVNETNWYVQLTPSAEPGTNAAFLIGTKEKDVNVIYDITVGDSLLSRKWLKLSNEQRRIEIPVTEDLRGNFQVSFSFVKKNRPYQNVATVVVPFTNKKLDITYETFRDKIAPGEKEEWRIKIADATGKPVNAEFLASMYDASLDVFTPHSWSFSTLRYNQGSETWSMDESFRINSWSGYSYIFITYFEPRYYEELNWFGFGYFGSRIRYAKGAMKMESDVLMAESAAVAEEAPSSASVTSANNVVSNEPPSVTQVKPSIPVVIRSDFRETAFFYPSVVTDKDGSLVLKFTAPGSLTRWNFLGLAHTKDLKTELITKEIVTSKDLMVFPNAPRFVRQGDTLVLSTKIVNLSSRALNGEVLLELSDPVSGKSVDLISGSSSQMFSIPDGESRAYSWKIAVPADASLAMLQYRITARSGNFSDGEEKAIPVLTNRMMVTESMPMPVRGAGSFSFDMKKLSSAKPSKTLKNYRLTLEFSSNPAWYAVQALPTLDDPAYPSADAIFNALYANSIAAHIANSDPKIRAVFESWKNITPDALLSALEKNQELKTAVLQETPWVMDAKNESQRKQRLGRLFDLNSINAKLDEYSVKLRNMQRSDGGWAWFEGMQPSRYMTQNIVMGFGRLGHLGITDIRNDKDLWDMISKGINYLDIEVMRDFNWIRNNNKNYQEENHLNGTIIQYLYARSYFMKDVPVAKSIKDAFDFYKKQAEKYWTGQDLYYQGMIALAMNRLGNKEVSALIMKSLTEKALHSPEMGMYWAMNSGYYWYEAPVESEALMIEAFDEINGDVASVNEMKIWLLKQKQTTDWKSGRATAEACYALLLRGADLLSDDQKVTVTVGKDVVDPLKMAGNQPEAGTGYFKVSWDAKEITPEMGKVKVSKTGEGVAWGALYWQYLEDLDKITPAKTPLTLEKKVFIEKNTPSGPVLEPVTDGNLLKVGDKLTVRIVLTADRALEYVHMKDMRASAFEPLVSSVLSGYRFGEGIAYYLATTDAATNFFFDYLPKGTYVFEYNLLVNAAGDYSNGITSVQCMYAPEFGAHSEGIRVEIR